MAKILSFYKKTNSDYYIIGLLLGVLRLEIENGTVNIESVYKLLSCEGRKLINEEKEKK